MNSIVNGDQLCGMDFLDLDFIYNAVTIIKAWNFCKWTVRSEFHIGLLVKHTWLLLLYFKSCLFYDSLVVLGCQLSIDIHLASVFFVKSISYELTVAGNENVIQQR